VTIAQTHAGRTDGSQRAALRSSFLRLIYKRIAGAPEANQRTKPSCYIPGIDARVLRTPGRTAPAR